MLMRHDVDVIGREIHIPHNDRAVAKNVSVDTVKLTFDTEWAECTSKVAIFKNGSVEFRAAVDGDTVQIPWEALDKPGDLYLSIVGYVGEEKRIVTEKMARPYRVRENGALAGEKPSDPTPDAVQVLLSQAGTATDAANSAAARAEAAQEAAVAGESARETAEASRRTAETARDSAESARVAGEAKRAAAESLRESSESSRISAEEARAAAELKRISAETGREVAEAARVVEFDQMRQDFQGMQFILLSEGQYDPDTSQPTVEGDTSVIYYVPNPRQTVGDLYLEWRYLKLSDGSYLWELIGGRDKLPDAITVADIDAVVSGSDVSKAERYLTLAGLSYLWANIKAWFAAKVHAHDAADIETGELSVAHGGTGASSAAGAQYQILGGMAAADSVEDPTFVLFREDGASATAGAVFKAAGSLVWNWLDAKIRATFGFDANGRIDGAHIKHNAISSDHIAADAVTSAKLADGSVGKDHLDTEMREGWESLSQPPVRSCSLGKLASFLRVGNTVFLHFGSKEPLQSGGNTICDTPEGFRPIWSVYAPTDTGGTSINARLYVSRSVVSVYNYSSGVNSNVAGYISYPTNDPMPEQ